MLQLIHNDNVTPLRYANKRQVKINSPDKMLYEVNCFAYFA